VVANCNGRGRNDDGRKTGGNEDEKWWKVYQVNRIAGQVSFDIETVANDCVSVQSNSD